MIKGLNDKKVVSVKGMSKPGSVPAPRHMKGTLDKKACGTDSRMRSMSMRKVMPKGSC